MKRYKCVFAHPHGKTTIELMADSAEVALREAEMTVSDDPDEMEVWDETGLVLQRRPPRSTSIPQ